MKGNELTGTPGETWAAAGGAGQIEGVAVDSSSGNSAGYVYVINNESINSLASGSGERAVDVFTSEGCFVREITQANVPEKTAFPEPIYAVAVDPSNGDVLVEDYDAPEATDAVYEFTEAGVFLGKLTGRSRAERFGKRGLSESESSGLAVGSNGDLYVNVSEKDGADVVVDEFGAAGFYPSAVTGGVSGVGVGVVTLTGTIRGAENSLAKEDLKLSKCEFEYVTDAAYQKEGFDNPKTKECAPNLEGQRLKEEDYAVSAEIGGLEEGTVYRYRVLAETDPGEHGAVKEGAAESFAAPAAPLVEDVSVVDVSSLYADFGATIDPRGEDTTYRFEYLSAEQYAADGESWSGPDAAVSVPVPAGDVGAGDAGVSVGVHAGGLLAGTSYRFRVVAQNGVGAVVGGVGAEGAFVTSPASVPGLPDGRVFELVTPPNKEDSEDLFGSLETLIGEVHAKEGLGNAENVTYGYSSEDGEHFLLLTSASFGPFPTTGNDFYVFSRGADGWSFRSSADPALGVQTIKSAVYDPADFSVLGVNAELGSLRAGSGEQLVDLLGPAGGPYATLASGLVAKGGSTAPPTEARVVGGSADLGHAILESEDHELASGEQEREEDSREQVAGSQALYESSGSGGLLLVNYNPKGELFKCGAVLGQSGGSENGSPVAGSTHGAVSADGSDVFFTAPDPVANPANGLLSGPGCWNGGTVNPPELYAREHGETTVEVSAPEEGVREGPGNPAEPAVFVGSSKDGAKVFFLTKTELTEEAVELGLHDVELYQYNTSPAAGEPTLMRVSRGNTVGGAPGVPGDVQNVPAVSSNGGAVYFNAGGALAPHPAGTPSGGLYRYDTETGTTVYVTQNTAYPALHEPARTWYGTAVLQNYVDVAGLWVQANYYTTDNGEFLLFASRVNLTGYDSGGQQELYRYHYEPETAGSIVCVSCNPDGSTPTYGATFTRSAMSGDNPAGAVPRPISEDGRYVFFDTQESLLPGDTNGKVDVYEWHEDPETHHGSLGSLSTGQSSTSDFFLDSSPDGKNVFFGTHSALVPADKDEQGDLYDARIEGGFPAPLGAGPCEGDACDHPPAAPIDATPGSLTLSGPGDVFTEVPPPSAGTLTKKTVTCKKGFVKKKVKPKTECVKKPKKKSKAKRASNDRRTKS